MKISNITEKIKYQIYQIIIKYKNQQKKPELFPVSSTHIFIYGPKATFLLL
jgi:hypothetical protein